MINILLLSEKLSSIRVYVTGGVTCHIFNETCLPLPHCTLVIITTLKDFKILNFIKKEE